MDQHGLEWHRTDVKQKSCKKASKGISINRELEDKGIYVRWTGRPTLAEEIQEAYKVVSQMVEVMHEAGNFKKKLPE